jgi:hypothetical protein
MSANSADTGQNRPRLTNEQYRQKLFQDLIRQEPKDQLEIINEILGPLLQTGKAGIDQNTGRFVLAPGQPSTTHPQPDAQAVVNTHADTAGHDTGSDAGHDAGHAHADKDEKNKNKEKKEAKEPPPFFSKEKLKQIVESKTAKRIDKVLPFVLAISPAARIGYEGISQITKDFANGNKSEAWNKIGYYTLRTGAAAYSGGVSELAYALGKLTKDYFSNPETRKKTWNWKTAGIGITAAISTWVLAPQVSNMIINAADSWGAVKTLSDYGVATNVIRPEFARAYMNLASRMALTYATGEAGKAIFKEQAEGFEVARRAATGLFALEAFGQNLYNSEGNFLTGNREVPGTDWKFTNPLSDLGEKLLPAANFRDSLIHGITHPQDIRLDQFNHQPDSNTPAAEPLQNIPGRELIINPDGTIQQTIHDPLPPAADPETYRFSGENNEPLALQPQLELPSHTTPMHGDFDLALQNNHTQLAMYHPEHHGTHLMSEVQGRVPGETDNNFERFEPDSEDANNLHKFIENPGWAVKNELAYHNNNTPVLKDDTLILGNIAEHQVNVELHEANPAVLEQAKGIVDDIGVQLTKIPNISSEIKIQFEYGGMKHDFTFFPHKYQDIAERGESLGDFLSNKLDEAIASNNHNLNSKIETIPFRSHPDFDTAFKVAFFEQFADKALQINDLDILDHSQGESIQAYNRDNHITFYEELAARLHHQSPEEAQKIFESRINPDIEPSKFALLDAQKFTQAGETRVDMVLDNHIDLIPGSELDAMYNLAVEQEHGLLNASNNYLGSRGITTSIQLSDGTILGFGSQHHQSDLVPGQEEHFVTDQYTTSSTGAKGLEDDLRAELKEINPQASEDQLDKLVVETSIKLAQVAETHNYGKYLEELLINNPGQRVYIEADGKTVLENFYIEYNKADNGFDIYANNNSQIGFLDAANFSDADLLIEKLSSDQFGLFAHNLQGLAIDPDATSYHTNIEYFEKSIMERFDEVLKANTTPTPPEPINMLPYHAVNGDPHSFYDNLKTYDQDHGIKILGTIIGDKLQSDLGHIATLDQEIVNRPEYPELSVVMDETPPATPEQLSTAANIGSILYYNPAQLVVLNNLQSNLIENASREIGEYYLGHPTELNVHPLVVTLPLTQAGYTADFNIQLNGGPVNFEALYTQIANYINSHVDSDTGQISDPYNPAFQAYVNHLMINNMMPELADRGIELSAIIDVKNYYYSVGDDHKLTIPISQLLNSNSGNVSQDLMSLSMQRVVGDPTLLSPESGLPALVPISVTPAAFAANAQANPIDPVQGLPPATAPLLPTIGNSIYNSFVNLGDGISNFRTSMLDTFLYLTGHPTTMRAVDGTGAFLGAVVEHGTPLARYSAEVAASYPTEYALDAADIAYTAKTNVLDNITLFGYRPFTMADNMLARPLNSLAELQYANRNLAGYGIDDLFNNVLSNVRTPGLYGYGDRGVTDPNAFNDWWNKAENFSNGLNNNIQNNWPDNYHLLNPGLYDTYTVQRGDSLSAIAGRIWGDQNLWPRLYEANRDIVEDPRVIFRGEVLRIPDINN